MTRSLEEWNDKREPKPRQVMALFVWRRAILESKLAATTRHILLTLACHMNGHGRSCFPSIETLKRETGLSRQSVMKHLKIAKMSNWITVVRRGVPGKRWKRNEYAVIWPRQSA